MTEMPGKDDLREFLKANATVIQAGETLVIRAPDFGPAQLREYNEWLNSSDESGPLLPFRVLVVHGDELGRIPAEAFAQLDMYAAARRELGRALANGVPAGLRPALRDLVREEIVAERRREVSWARAVRVDVFRDGAAEFVRMTHLPTGLQAEGPERDQVRAALERLVAARADAAAS